MNEEYDYFSVDPQNQKPPHHWIVRVMHRLNDGRCLVKQAGTSEITFYVHETHLKQRHPKCRCVLWFKCKAHRGF